jgi:hypothetical protein
MIYSCNVTFQESIGDYISMNIFQNDNPLFKVRKNDR